NLTCETTIQEDTESTCNLEATDEENDSISFSVALENNLNCTIEGNILTYIGIQNYNGPASCELKVSDGNDYNTKILDINISNINDVPYLDKEIPNITVNEDTQLKNAINLSDYFKDIDSQLEFTIVGNNHIQAEISNSLLTLTPNPEFVGAEEVYFTATDEEFNIISNTLSINVIEVNDAPVFSNLTCETTIQEDTESTCNLEATDEENDSISFSVALENNLNCTIEGNVLTYIGKKDYSGTAYCTLKVLDQFSGNDTRELNIMITPINDPPQIFSSDPAEDSINILEGKTETFIVNYIDIDSQNINISWFINDFPEPHSPYSTKEIIFDEPQGIYLIQAIISDEQYNIIRSWNVVVGSTKDFTCSEVGGNICQESQACSSSLVEVKDSNLCCATSCMPSFKAANACSIVNDSVKINILNPKQEDNIQLGKTLNIRIEIINDLEKDLDEDVEISLYDLTTDKVIEKQDASIAVDKGGHSSTEYIDLDIPSDIDLDHDYALYTKTIGDICTQSYQNVNLKRPDNNVVLSKFEMPNKAECGDIVNVKLKAENLGGKNQDVSITLKNTELRVNNSTGKFTIEKQGDSDTQNEELSFIIPRNVNTGEYKIKASVDSSTETDTHTRTLQVECNTEEVQQVSIPPQNNTIVLTAVNENQQPIEEPISLLSIGLIASSFILIALMAVLYFVFMSSKRSVPELSANKIQHSTIKPLSKTKKRK
ncbi:MAG: Ig-like domain-containing protein, partial [Nanoarchaeota archaeon]|nr:Ig-like domain-containing protein [Nanoarchaeota archaeon]